MYNYVCVLPGKRRGGEGVTANNAFPPCSIVSEYMYVTGFAIIMCMHRYVIIINQRLHVCYRHDHSH